MTLIDTSAWIEFLRKGGDAAVKSRVAALIEFEEAAYCGPVKFELLTGARPAEVGDLVIALGFASLLEFPLACWERAAEMERALRSKGVTVPRDDVFVAAAALHHGTLLYAADGHFELMRQRGGFELRLV